MDSKGVMDDSITKKRSKYLVIPIGKITNCMALIFSRDYPFIKSGLF